MDRSINNETAFTMDTSSIKYGPRVTREIGFDMQQYGASRVLLVSDPNVAKLEPVSMVMSALEDVGIEVELFDQVHIEPTDQSMKEAVAFAEEGEFDGYIAVGGGSTIDTAKVANLYATYPADFLTYVNAPIGKGEPVPGKLKPLIAVPTTAGTGSETTGVAIFDYLEMHAKTGIAHRALRPVMGIVDPENTRTLPPMAVACSGFDVLCHAIESLTALPYDQRPKAEHPKYRPAYQGANPISDIWSSKAIEMVSSNMLKALEDPDDDEARGAMILAAAFAGIGFGNAGVHLPHGMSYPVSGMVKGYRAEGYPEDRNLIPHGMSVVLNAPAVFRFTAEVNPDRHLEAARLMGIEFDEADPQSMEAAGEILAQGMVDLMKKTDMPNGLQAVGYTEADVDALVEGTLPQHRVTKLSPRAAGAGDLRELFLESMRLW